MLQYTDLSSFGEVLEWDLLANLPKSESLLPLQLRSRERCKPTLFKGFPILRRSFWEVFASLKLTNNWQHLLKQDHQWVTSPCRILKDLELNGWTPARNFSFWLSEIVSSSNNLVNVLFVSRPYLQDVCDSLN